MPSEPRSQEVSAPSVPWFMKLLLGLSGLGIVVGFFMPWFRETQTLGTGASTSVTHSMVSGLGLLMRDSISGTPNALLLLVPAIGLLIASTAFVGFRYAGQLAILAALVLVGYAVYVIFSVFVGLTGAGLWLVVASLVQAVLYGVITTLMVRSRAERYEMWKKTKSDPAAISAATPARARPDLENASGATSTAPVVATHDTKPAQPPRS